MAISFLSFTAHLAGGAGCHGVIGSAQESQWVSAVSYSQGRGKKPKKQIKDTASVKANPVYFLIRALISQKCLQDLMLLQQPDGEVHKADEWQQSLKSPPTCEAHSQGE